MRMKIHFLVAILFFAFLNKSFPQDIHIHVDTNRIKTDALFLASDSLEGRKTGERGNTIAAEYIKQRLKKYNLKPGFKNSYFQNVPIHSSIASNQSKMIIYTSKFAKKLNYGIDYLIDESGEQTIIPKPYPLVFVGYGIDAPEFNYNDYRYLNVEGKIVVFISGEPGSNDSSYFNGKIPSLYSYPAVKHKIAISKGARGSILIRLPNDRYLPTWEGLRKEYTRDYMVLAGSFIGNLNLIFTYHAARWLFADSDYNMKDIVELHSDNKMISFPLEARISFIEKFKQKDFISHNVLGVIKGSGKNKDEFVLVTAHFDHLGIGEPVAGDSIYNGFLDNALGTSSVIEIARILNSYKNLLNRSILIMLVTGEEFGLLGSRYFLYNPPYNLSNIVANINVDGIAVIDNFKSIVGIGAKYSTLGEILDKTVKQENLKTAGIPPEFRYWESFHRSDQSAYAQAGIPSILISEGLDYVHYSKQKGIKKYIEYMQYYHTPFDDIHLKINYSAVKQNVYFLTKYIIGVANSKSRPQWYPNSIYNKLK